jgi:hypothetical protein
LMIVGFLALVAAALVGLNWTGVSGTADRETKQEQAEVKTQKPAKKKTEDKSSSLRDDMQKRCEKLVAKHVADDVEKEDIQDACACAADDIQAEFADELPAIKSGDADLKTVERVDEIINDCVQSAGLDFQ